MKTHTAPFETRVYCVRIEPIGSTGSLLDRSKIIRLAGYPVNMYTSNRAKYLAENGYEFSGIAAESTFASASVDLSGVLDSGAVSRDDLNSGVYDNARVYLFATDWTNPIEDDEPLALLFWGKVSITDFKYRVELMGAIDALSQVPNRTYSVMCPWTFLDRSIDSALLSVTRSRCIGPRNAPDGPNFDALVRTLIVNTVPDRFSVLVSDDGSPPDYYGNGELQYITGANTGLKPLIIKNSGLVMGLLHIVTHEAALYAVQPGDQFRIIPGCRKRKQEDCKTKWNNVINNGSFPDIPTPTQYSQRGRQ